MAAPVNRPNNVVMNLARATLTTPATGHLINLADQGDMDAIRTALKYFASHKIWQVYEVMKNGQLFCYIWGEDKVDALVRWMPTALAGEWNAGSESTAPPSWEPTDQMTVQKCHLPSLMQSLRPAQKQAILVQGWKAIMRARGKEVPNGFCHRELYQAPRERIADGQPTT